jgi:hypothetical protein
MYCDECLRGLESDDEFVSGDGRLLCAECHDKCCTNERLKDYHRKVVALEAERDQAKAEVERLRVRVSDLKFALGDDAGWFDRAKAAERERDADRTRIAELERENERLHTTCETLSVEFEGAIRAREVAKKIASVVLPRTNERDSARAHARRWKALAKAIRKGWKIFERLHDERESELEASRAEAARLRLVLRDVEWDGALYAGEYGFRRCPVCMGREPTHKDNLGCGHRRDCALAAALKEGAK